jgi:hypothetical protein
MLSSNCAALRPAEEAHGIGNWRLVSLQTFGPIGPIDGLMWRYGEDSHSWRPVEHMKAMCQVGRRHSECLKHSRQWDVKQRGYVEAVPTCDLQRGAQRRLGVCCGGVGCCRRRCSGQRRGPRSQRWWPCPCDEATGTRAMGATQQIAGKAAGRLRGGQAACNMRSPCLTAISQCKQVLAKVGRLGVGRRAQKRQW